MHILHKTKVEPWPNLMIVVFTTREGEKDSRDTVIDRLFSTLSGMMLIGEIGLDLFRLSLGYPSTATFISRR